MVTRIYKTPFAASGDKEPLATADQPDGKVSLQAGWTPDYELPNDDANYRPVGRAETNGVFNELTVALGEVQLMGFAKWQAIDGGWPLGAQVSHNAATYRSTTNANTTTPGVTGSGWALIITTPESLPVASTSQAGIVALATNAATQAGTASNVAVTPAGLSARTATEGRTGMVELATAAEVRAGTDTTRSVTPAGLQSKVATTAQAQALADNTVLLTPKTLGDALGVVMLGRGQKWKVFTGSRAIGVTYTNTTKAPIAVAATVYGTTANSTVACSFTVHSGPDLVPGIFAQAFVTNTDPAHWSPAAFAIVPAGETYALAATQATLANWMELRL